MTQQKKPNRLIHARSPYLRQHAWNPVDWYEWGPEALNRAKTEQKPIFLSIGYSSCHWCHVMEREAFSDPEIAEFLNKHFIPIKVDREERPDLDWIYMQAVMAMTGHGGWPLNVFLTPDLEPFYGGTYFPPHDAHGRPGFMRLLREIHKAWQERNETIREIGRELRTALQKAVDLTKNPPPSSDEVVSRLIKTLQLDFDPRWGGFGQAPKFPPHMALNFLLQSSFRYPEGRNWEMIHRTLEAMAGGGIHDHVGGGFHRYAVDPAWQVPHFEKMLSDNALLADIYTRAWWFTGRPLYRIVAQNILDYLIRDMVSPDGLFFTSEDADADGKEGTFYVWTPDEIRRILPSDEAEWVVKLFNLTEHGNFEEGKSTLVVDLGQPEAEQLYVDAWQTVREVIYRTRQKRPRPFRDEKILTDWNALAISAFVRAGVLFQDKPYLEQALRTFDALRDCMWKEGKLYHHAMNGERGGEGFLLDYAAFASAAVDVYEATARNDALELAVELVDRVEERFRTHTSPGYFDALASDERICSIRETFDGALPSGNSMMAQVLSRLYYLTGEPRFGDRLEQLFGTFADFLQKHPERIMAMVTALDFHASGPISILTATTEGDVLSILERLNTVPSPYRVIGWITPSTPAVFPAFVEKTAHEGKTTYYLCQNFTCGQPLMDLGEVLTKLRNMGHRSDPKSPR